MDDIHVGDKVVVKLKEYFSGEGNAKPRVQGEVKFVNTRANFSVVDVGKYSVTYWNNEIMPFDPEKFRVTVGNRVEYISPSSVDEDASEEQ
ncbi:MAG: hypothetical protein ACI4WS_11585 [Oscillospiraceae bacterium]